MAKKKHGPIKGSVRKRKRRRDLLPGVPLPTPLKRGRIPDCVKNPDMPNILEQIFLRIAHGETLRSLCGPDRPPGWPEESTVRVWLANDTPPGIFPRYARARALQLEAWADMVFDFSTKPLKGVRTITRTTLGKDDDGNEVVENVVRESIEVDAVDRARLASDNLRWLLSKLHPKQYGETPLVQLNDNRRTVRVTLVPSDQSREMVPQGSNGHAPIELANGSNGHS